MIFNNSTLLEAKLIANKGTVDDLEQAELILLDYLKINPQDTDAWLMLIMIEWTPPLEDSDRIIQWCHNILSYDPTNARGLLVLAEAYVAFRGGINQVIYKQLGSAQSDNPDFMAMIEVAKAKYLTRIDETQYEKVLKRSIELGPLQARNYRMLGELYMQQGKFNEGEQFLKKAQENRVKSNSLNIYEYDVTSLIDFLNEFYTGL